MTTSVGIIGAAGLSGLELIGWLSHHPQVNIQLVTSSKYAGQRVRDIFPFYANTPFTFQAHEASAEGCDLVFLAVPNQASLDLVPHLIKQDIKVIDLSGVYRLKNLSTFEKAYQLQHTSPDLLKEAVFGLPECYSEDIKHARLIANPGCYPTGALLGLLPMREWFPHLKSSPIIDAKSGVSGAGGRVEGDDLSYGNVNENFKAYKLFKHQHQPEIQCYLEQLTAYQTAQHGEVIFTPHLLPVHRGILTTIYLQFQQALQGTQVRQRFTSFAQEHPFIHLLAEGVSPELHMVQHTNHCHMNIFTDASQKNWIIVTAIDNLLKGASGQAIQNMNLMCGYEETLGLSR